MPFIVGGGLIFGGAIGNFFAGKSAADAQEQIAKMQKEMALQVLQWQRQDRQTALGLAGASPQELAQINQQLLLSMNSLNSQLGSIAKDEELLHAVDPALKEAGMQAYRLMKGQQAEALAPIRAERARQRVGLETALRDQLGSGYKTSTAGFQALSQFDQQTAATLQQTQDATLQSFLGISAGVRPDVSGKLARAFGGAAQIGATGLSALQNITGRQVAAFNQSPINYQPLLSTAGADSVGDLTRANNLQGLFGGLSQLGGMGVGMGLQNYFQKDILGSIFPKGSFGTQLPAPYPGLPQFKGSSPAASFSFNPVTGAPMFGGGGQ
jgi:hypothetical protein